MKTTAVIKVSTLLLMGGTGVSGFVSDKASTLARPFGVVSSVSLLAHESEFEDIFHDEQSNTRKTRLAHEGRMSQKFASGEELKNLRSDLETLRHNLQWAEALKDQTRIDSLKKAIKNGEKRDPDLMYTKSLKLIKQAKIMKDATKEEREALVEKWVKVAADARDFLPQFNLEGLWIGKYGEHGNQMINVTYVDDTLVATKVTGDRNVPRGETSFSVDVSAVNASMLPPIQLVSDSRNGEFQRFPGKGQVSRRGFKDHRYVEGQMIMFENQFSFVWIPTKHHVLFSRPTPEMTIKMLRDTISKEDEMENMRDHVARCFDMDMTTCLARQQDPTNFEPLRRITPQDELDSVEEISKHSEKNIFWQLNKWRKYIDQTLDK